MYQEAEPLQNATATTARPHQARRRWWKIAPVAATALVFVVVVPALEINDSHLFNPDWPAHARLHEAWQLLTNASLAMAAAWMAIIGRERLAAGLALLTVGPLLAAYAFRALYGGSMSRQGSDDGILSSAGSLVIFMLFIGFSLIAALLRRAKPGSTSQAPDRRSQQATSADQA